jgi:hypothetical protein
LSVSSDGAQLTISWEGGNAPYTVQSKSSLSDASWTDNQTTDATSVAIPIESGNAFFRVVSGGQ